MGPWLGGNADIRIDVRGTRAEGQLTATGEQQGDVWQWQVLTLATANERLDLLTASETTE